MSDPRESTFFKVTIILGFLAELGLVVMFALGIVDVYGETLGPLRAVNLITALFSFSRAKSFECLFGALLAVFYFVVLVIMLKNFALGARAFSRLRSGDVDDARDSCADVRSRVESSVLWGEIFLIACCAFGDGSLSLVAMLVLAAALLINELISVAFICDNVQRRGADWQPETARVVSMAVTTACALLCFWFLSQRHFGSDTIDGFSMFFRGNIGFAGGFGNFVYSFYLNFAEPILFFVLVGLCFAEEDIKALIVCGVMLVMQFICRGLLAFDLRHFSPAMFTAWFDGIKSTLLPVFLLQLGVTWVRMQKFQ